MNYYIGDLHLGHDNCIHFDNRPFQSVDEMDEAIIQNWNGRVTSEDTVYILGDAFFKNEERSIRTIERLNGHKHLIRGNHDRVHGKLANYWESIQYYLELDDKVDDEKIHLILCHFAMPFYNRGHYGSVMLYGHVHSSREWIMLEKWKRELWEMEIPCNMINVGCMMDYMGYTPRTAKEILAANPIPFRLAK